MARLLSVNVGLPRDVKWHEETVHTSVWKLPVTGRRMARKLNLDGDGQGDLAGHGGEHRAVLVYQKDSYRYWENVLGRSDFSFGQFGENFTVDGLPDDEVCIGDQFRIGDAVFEVTQPRVTCYRVGIRMNEPRMAALLVAHHRPGFYLRVLQEGEVGAGDEITKVADGPERFTVSDIDALLYLPGHSQQQLQRALRIPALSHGWQDSFRTMLRESASSVGNPGLAVEEHAPAWAGFRPMRVAQIRPESQSVTSIVLVPSDEQPLPPYQAGQFIVVRLPVDPAKAPVLRSYSLSDLPGPSHFRISVKRESQGIGSAFLCDRTRPGDLLDVSAPRGSFTLKAAESPVVLLSAGVGATPVLAMLHSLAATRSTREIWWIFGARNRSEHPFADETLLLLKQLPRARGYIVYSRPTAAERPGIDFDAPGHIDKALLEKLGVAQNADFYLCGPTPFLESVRSGLQSWGVANEKVHTELFGALEEIAPGIARTDHTPHLPEGPPGSGPAVSFARSGIRVPWNARYGSLLELAEGCDVPVRFSCRTGVCHTCVTGLIGGSVRYNPEPLERPASGNVLVCCAQPETEIILDL